VQDDDLAIGQWEAVERRDLSLDAPTAFDVDEDGSLSNRHVWAELGQGGDGICLDAEGAVVAERTFYSVGGGFVMTAEELAAALEVPVRGVEVVGGGVFFLLGKRWP